MTEYTVGQYCRFVRETQEYRIYSFCLFIQGTDSILSEVAEVEYTLDPSFPDPVRVSTDVKHAFPLQSEAWGAFTTYIRIFEKSGSKLLEAGRSFARIQYRLKLQDNAWPMGSKLTEFSSSSEQLIYEALSDPKWEWRKLSTLARRASMDADEARKILNDLEQRGAVRKAAHVHFIEKEELWGATSVVGLLPQPRS
jgi:transcription initiation factor IIF auxiliary subunit